MKGLPFNPLPVIEFATGYVVNVGVGEQKGNFEGQTAERTEVKKSMFYLRRS